MRRLVNPLWSKFNDGTVRRFLFVSAIAFWLGGFTFYGSVVIPSGMKVLHGHVKQGFITQQVTEWLNVSGAVAWEGASKTPARGRVEGRGKCPHWIAGLSAWLR